MLALGLPNAAASVPLGADPATHEHVGILVEGVSAQPVGDGARTFDAAQVSRAATYRLDLAVGLTAPDSDLDGIADWWEDRYGTDKQNGADGGLDPDGDGISNLDEYLAGTDPSRDDRQPLLLTTDMRAYADGTTGMLAEEQRTFCRVVRGQQPVPNGARYEDAMQLLRWLDQLERLVEG